MIVKVEKLTDWDLVYKVALYTQGKTPKKQYPSEEWKKKTVIAQHSPLRALQFQVTIEDVPNFVLTHLSRHVHAQPYIRTMREDITGIKNKDITRNTWNNGTFIINAQEMINISRDRLCNKASKETKWAWESVIEQLKVIDHQLGNVCKRHCEFLGFCKEYMSCGYHYEPERNNYLKYIYSRV